MLLAVRRLIALQRRVLPQPLRRLNWILFKLKIMMRLTKWRNRPTMIIAKLILSSSPRLQIIIEEKLLRAKSWRKKRKERRRKLMDSR